MRQYVKPCLLALDLRTEGQLCLSPPHYDDDNDDDEVEITFGIEIGPGWNDAYHKEIWEE